MKRTICSAICGLSALMLTSLCPAHGAENKSMLRESDFVMSRQEASKFSDEVLSPILFAFAESDSTEFEPLRTRIRTLLEKIQRHEIQYSALPAYHPNRKLHVLAKVQRLDSKPIVLMFVPEIVAWRKTLSESDFKYGMLVTLAHEMIHLELGHDFERGSDKDAARDEADAWSRTIVEFVRPLQAKRLANIGFFRELSDRLKAVKDNPEDPKWVKLFMPQ